MRLFIYLVLLLIPVSGWSYSVGSRLETLENISSGRDLKVRLFYPTSGRGEPQLMGNNSVFTGYRAIPDAPLASGHFPLILLSHGSGGNNTNLAWLATALAERGAIVVAASHPGSTTGDSRPETDLTLQTRDLSLILDHYLTDSAWKNAIDATKIGAAGHSKGGYSVLALAGGLINRQRLDHYCEAMPQMPDCRFYKQNGVQLEKTDDARLAANYRDPRIKFAIALDPGMSYVLTPESLKAISIPVLTIAAGYYSRPTGKMTLGTEKIPTPRIVIQQAGHFDFLPVCQPTAEKILAEEGEAFICDTPASQRELIHQQTITAITVFLQHLGIESTAKNP
ncbi:hypothetical protein [Erwinia sp. JUb26]|uniref:alpha/beta hydrolase family protein n=1 Tax=Erwinia sp. JUb26 TaxID=2485126 RepID=UPI000F46C115|nr:hypothetical protein [Erwinia sp. JUb26]ROR07803.1 putative dienelactone hydrolase [Erwinia sp. JUb26]